MLWEDGNLWRDELNAAVLQQGGGKFVVPYGDPNDKLSVTASNITTANYARLEPLLRRYGASKALIAVIFERGSNGLGLTLREISARGDSLNISHVEPKPGVNTANLLHEAAEDLIGNYFKRKELAEHPEQAVAEESHDVSAYIALNNARDWGDLRARLNNVPVIENMQVMNADAQGITMNITFKGNPAQFGESLVAQGIYASKQNDQLWLTLR